MCFLTIFVLSRYAIDNDTIELASTTILPSPTQGSYLGDIPSLSADSRHYTSLSPLSPASSISSFSITHHTSKHSKSTKLPSKLMVDFLQQSSSICKVLSLSDSEKNYFSDKNYDNVNLCCCVERSGVEPKSLKYKQSSKMLDTQNCTCGFLSFEQFKFSKGQGLFPEDELSTRLAGNDRTDMGLACSTNAVEVKQEKSTVVSLQTDSMFDCLVDVVVDQCSSPFSCSMIKQQINRTVETAPIENVPSTKGEMVILLLYYYYQVLLLWTVYFSVSCHKYCSEFISLIIIFTINQYMFHSIHNRFCYQEFRHLHAYIQTLFIVGRQIQ